MKQYMRLGCISLARVCKLGKSSNKKAKQRLGSRDKIPSHTTITKIMIMINPNKFEELLGKMMKQAVSKIAMDYK